MQDNNIETVNFNKCTLAFMERSADLIPKPATNFPMLQAWTTAQIDLTDLEKEVIKMFVQQLDDNSLHWREYDLAMHFIGPLFSLVNFTVWGRFNLFGQENFEAQINDKLILMGRVDEVIATGFRSPETPIFAFNEYKKETDPDGDPNGQCLAAMLVGQKLNNNDLPMYGCVVIGRVWRFVVLQQHEYAFSRNFDGAVFEEACQIVRILKQLKLYCMERTA